MSELSHSMLKIWTLASPYTGDENAGVGVAQQLSSNYELVDMKGEAFSNHGNAGAKEWLEQKMNKSLEEFSDSDWPDIIIGGTPSRARMLCEIKRLSGNKTKIINLQDPKQGHRDFDLIANYSYQNIPYNNAQKYIGVPNKITEETLRIGQSEWGDQFSHFNPDGKPFFSLLVGGNIGDRIIFTPERAAELGKKVNQMVQSQGGVLVVTNSRRTPDEATRALMNEITVPWYFHDWKRDGGNPYFGLLALSDHIIVTGDSLSMCSEAVGTGKPVYIDAPEGSVEPQHTSLIADLYRLDLAKPLTGEFTSYNYTPLNTAKNIAHDIRSLFQTQSKQRQY